MTSKSSSKPEALLPKRKASTTRAAKPKSPTMKAKPVVTGYVVTFAVGIPKPLTGKQASKAVREAGVVTAAGNLKARFR